MRFDWARHEELYKRLQSQNMNEAFAMREMDEHDRDVADQMLDWIPPDVESVLDLGAKDGYAAWKFSQAVLKAVAFDIVPEFVQKCRGRGIETVLGDMHFMQFEDESFDLVYASHILEYSVMPILCLGEWARVSKKWLLIRLPRYPTFVRMVSHWAVVPTDVLECWFSGLLLSIERYEKMKWHEDCYLLKKHGHWPKVSWDEQMNVMAAVRKLNKRRGFVKEINLDKV